MKFTVNQRLAKPLYYFAWAGVACGWLSSASHICALDYGVYDARALAMGGSGVASATAQHALFYNPALLAFYDGEEEDTQNGRIYLPIVVAEVSDVVQEAFDVIEQNLDNELSDAVDAFNDTGDPSDAANRAAVALAGQNLLDGINQIGNRELESEAFLGFSVSEPSDREGGSFYFGSRAVAAGVSNITQEDIDLLQRYIDAMSSATPEVDFPDLFNDDGTLTDPADTISSSANIGSLIITEWGVSLSREFTLWGQALALGITPKIMHVDIFREDFSYTNSDFNYQEDKRTHISMNTDIGIAMPIGEHFRLGLAAKDILPKEYEGGNELSVSTRARSRFAAAYIRDWITLAMDVDLQKNESLGAEQSGQELTLGGELRIVPLVDLRAGYRQDLEGLENDVLSFGVGIKIGRLVGDIAYAFSSSTDAGSVQVGWTF